MDPITLATLGGMAAVVAVFARLIYDNDARRTRRVLRRTKVTPIADLIDGQLACIVGRVELPEGTEPIVAMMSRRRCVACETTVHTYELGSVRSEVERTIVPFFVVDATGRARIDAAQAALANRPIARGDRFEERVIALGATVRLVGSVRLEPAMPAITKERLFREGGFAASLTGTAKFPLLVDTD